MAAQCVCLCPTIYLSIWPAHIAAKYTFVEITYIITYHIISYQRCHDSNWSIALEIADVWIGVSKRPLKIADRWAWIILPIFVNETQVFFTPKLHGSHVASRSPVFGRQSTVYSLRSSVSILHSPFSIHRKLLMLITQFAQVSFRLFCLSIP